MDQPDELEMPMPGGRNPAPEQGAGEPDRLPRRAMDQPAAPPYERLLLVCCNERDPGEAACANRGSVALHKALKQGVKDLGLKGRVRVTRSLCLGLCDEGPNVCVMPDNVWYHHVGPDDIPKILDRHVRPLLP